MQTASLNLTVTQRRLLTKREAASHCGLPAKVFDRICPAKPLRMANGYDRYDVRDLDAWIDRLKGDAGTESDDDIVGRLA